MTSSAQLIRLLRAAVAATVAIGILASAAFGNANNVRHRLRSVTCAEIAFAPASDNIAFHIRASGVSCLTGREVANASRSERLRPGPGRVYRAAGFACTGTFVKPMGKWYERYVCRSGQKEVVFDRG